MPPYSRTQTGWQSCAIWQIYWANWTNWISLQGKDTSILNLYDKVGGFLKKAELWRGACAQGNFTCFPQVDDFLSVEDVNRAPVKSVIVGHLTNLIQDFHSYFPDIEEKSTQLCQKPISLVWNKQKQATCRWSGKTHESVIWPWPQDEVCHIHTHTVLGVCEGGHPDLGQKALEQLLPFASTYLCEASFSATTVIKTKQRNRLWDCAWRRAWSQQLPPYHRDWPRSLVKHKHKFLTKTMLSSVLTICKFDMPVFFWSLKIIIYKIYFLCTNIVMIFLCLFINTQVHKFSFNHLSLL